MALEDDFCDVLSKALRGNGIDATELAARIGVDAASVAQWTAGPSTPERAVVARIAQVLDLGPERLIASAEQSRHPHVETPASVRMYSQHPQPSNGYLLRSDDDTELAAFDTAGEPRTILDAIATDGRPLRYVVITHRHADHCDAARVILEHHRDAKLLMNPIEAAAVGALSPIVVAAGDGAHFRFGTTEIESRCTRGHTDGATTFAYGNLLFVGDTLFAGSVGRVFGPTSTYAELLHSVRTRILCEADECIILPGHGPLTTVGDERRHNPFFP